MFLFGSQYYRAPTPHSDCWEADHRRMADLGFNSVKYWVQWRWTHRTESTFLFDDLDRLMDLAATYRLKASLNVIFDVAPHWLYRKYPDAKQIMNDGRIVEPSNQAHRQIGGSPGPCYNHPGALAERQIFLEKTVEHFGRHPAMDGWDLWNEPELCFPQRTPDIASLACYCPHCETEFRLWLENKYGTLDHLNDVWGRCYSEWLDVEMPRTPETITDFVDWRDFHSDTLTHEARWRFETTRRLDPGRTAFLHSVPNNLSCWTSLTTCTDDFRFAEMSDIWASTYSDGADWMPYLTSPAKGKTVYNTETHIDFGMANMHQRILHLPDFLRTFLPQIGMGIRGFQFWQFRSETLGFEAPAWGLVHTDGSDRPATKAAEIFWKKLRPHADALVKTQVDLGEVAVWKSRKNDVAHWAIHRNFDGLIQSLGAYVEALYAASIPFRFVDEQALAGGDPAGVKLLILPEPYYLTQAEADGIDRFLQAGGTVLSEAHLGAYLADAGRHSTSVPGCGLAARWGLIEADTTSSYHLKLQEAMAYEGVMTEDVKKQLISSKTTGGKYFPISLKDGSILWGSERFAILEGEDLDVLGTYLKTETLLVHKKIGDGHLFYGGTNVGQGSPQGVDAFRSFLGRVLSIAGVEAPGGIQTAPNSKTHLDLLRNGSDLQFLMLHNNSDTAQDLRAQIPGRWQGIYSDATFDFSSGNVQSIPARFCDLLSPEI